MSGEGAVRVDSDDLCFLGGAWATPVDVLGCGEGGRGVRALFVGLGACFFGRGGGGAPTSSEDLACTAAAEAAALVSNVINGTICTGGDGVGRRWRDGVT